MEHHETTTNVGLSLAHKLDYNLTFHREDERVGVFDFSGSRLVFEGDAEESAKLFVAWVADVFQARLKEERERGREEALQEMRDGHLKI
jgi:hypothetical protein